MAKDDKGGDEKEKKEAGKALQDSMSVFGDIRSLHAELGKHLDDYDKQAAALADAMKKDQEEEQAKRWKIMNDLQTKIFETTQEITANKKMTQDKAYKKLDSYIRG